MFNKNKLLCLKLFIGFMVVSVYIFSFSTAFSEDVYVRYQGNLKNVFTSMNFGASGEATTELSFTAEGSSIESARGNEAFEKADIAWTGNVNGKTVARISPGQKVHTTLGSIESLIPLLKKTDDKGFGSIGKTEIEKKRSTAEIVIKGRYATIIGLKGVEGEEDGFLIVVGVDRRGDIDFNVGSGISLGGRFKVREE